jgi:RcsF lipoprotein
MINSSRTHSRPKLVCAVGLLCVVTGCVSGTPQLTVDQYHKLSTLKIYRAGEALEKPYRSVGRVDAADCSGHVAGARLSGSSDAAIETLKSKAAALNADAVINVTCAPTPFLNTCWAAQECSGEAVVFQSQADHG